MQSHRLSGIEEALGYTFRDKALLLEALTHRSYHYEHPKKAPYHNERLEFLGDSVLSFIAARMLFALEERLSEAAMSRLKAHIVNGATLSDAAGDIDIGSYLRLGKGEEETGGKEKKSLRADAIEAVIGAVYLDGGTEEAERLIARLLGQRIKKLLQSGEYHDYKSRLQEETQMRLGVLPEYRVISEEGKAHKKIFSVEVYVGQKRLGRGMGGSKKEAESAAAKEAIDGPKGIK